MAARPGAARTEGNTHHPRRELHDEVHGCHLAILPLMVLAWPPLADDLNIVE